MAERRRLLAFRLADVPDDVIVEEMRRRSIDFDLSSLPGSALARELVRRRKSRPAGRPAHPMRDCILAERAVGVSAAELARRHRVSVRTISRIVSIARRALAPVGSGGVRDA
jgi:DNA-directed RNA polymerase specialized sigma24 family protein